MGGSAVIHKQNKFMKIFNDAGATDEAHAVIPREMGIRRNFIFERMVDRGIFIECGNGKFYIDNRAAEQFREMRRKKAWVVLGICFIMIALSYLSGLR